MRHSFWNLNREIIEDIRELMVTRKRASQRMGRLDRSAVDGVELATTTIWNGRGICTCACNDCVCIRSCCITTL